MSRAPAPFRFAIRTEGSMVNAYFAKTETMAGAVLLASAQAESVKAYPDLWQAFTFFVQGLAHAHVKRTLGLSVVDFGEAMPAPEHEKAGHA